MKNLYLFFRCTSALSCFFKGARAQKPQWSHRPLTSHPCHFTKVMSQVSVPTRLTTTKTACGIVKMMVVRGTPIAKKIHRLRKTLALCHACPAVRTANVILTMVVAVFVNATKVKHVTTRTNAFLKKPVRILASLRELYVVRFAEKIAAHAARVNCARKGLV